MRIRSHPGRIAICLALCCASPTLMTGCVSSGEGWAVGSLWLENCNHGDALDRPDDFGLDLKFFGGDPIVDTADNVSARENKLVLRMQESPSRVEEANGIVIQFHDLAAVAKRFVRGELIPISADGLCPGCTNRNPMVRVQMYLFVGCPDSRAPLIGSPFALIDRSISPTGTATEASCYQPPENIDLTAEPACPSLTSPQRTELNAMCTGGFTSNTIAKRLTAIWGGASCLYLCKMADLTRCSSGQSNDGGLSTYCDDPSELNGYRVDFGDRLSGFFVSHIIDQRAVVTSRCGQASGEIAVGFNIKVDRNRIAQPFP